LRQRAWDRAIHNHNYIRIIFGLAENDKQTIFSNVYKLLLTFQTIPVINGSSEQAFSQLTIMKSELGSTMTQGRLNSLMLIFVE